MKAKPAKPKPAPKKVRPDIELLIGIFTLPDGLLGPGGTDAEILVWMLAGGPILGKEIARPDVLREKAGAFLRESMAELPALPGTVVVAKEDLAALLRPAITPRIELICSPTPELAGGMVDYLEKLKQLPTFLSGGAEAEAAASFCRAAARFFRAITRRVLPRGRLLGITVEELGIENQILSISNAKAGHKVWMLCSDAMNLDRFNHAARRRDSGKSFEFPPYSMMVFGTRRELPPTLSYEIETHGWETPAANVYPWLFRGEPFGSLTAPTREDLLIGEVVNQALADLLESSVPLPESPDDQDPVVIFKTKIKADNREIEALISVPFKKPESLIRPEHPILGALFELRDEEIDLAVRNDLDLTLIAEFLASPFGVLVQGPTWIATVLSLAANQIGLTAGYIDKVDLEEILLEYFPMLIDAEAEDAEDIIAQCSAFFSFLTSLWNRPNLHACNELLKREGFLPELEEALTDPRNFGLDKMVIMAGASAGFDTHTDKGLADWFEYAKAKGLSPTSRLMPSIDLTI